MARGMVSIGGGGGYNPWKFEPFYYEGDSGDLTDSSWNTVVDITGKGILNLAFVSGNSYEIKITIDGTLSLHGEAASTFGAGLATYTFGVHDGASEFQIAGGFHRLDSAIIPRYDWPDTTGSQGVGYVAEMGIPFSTSCKVEIYDPASSGWAAVRGVVEI